MTRGKLARWWRRLAIVLTMVGLMATAVVGTPTAASAAEDEGPKASAGCEVATWFTYAAADADVFPDSVQVEPFSDPDQITVEVRWVVRKSGKKASVTLDFNTKILTSKEVPALRRARIGSIEAHLTVRNNGKWCKDVGHEK